MSNILLFVHLLAVIAWIGGAFVGTLIGTRIRASGDSDAMAKFCAAFAQVAGPVFGGSGVLVLLTGIGMVAREGAPGFGDLWISIGFAGWFVSLVLGAAFVGKAWFQVGNGLAKPGETITTLEPLINKAVMLTWIDLAIRVAVVYVMVWKPT